MLQRCLEFDVWHHHSSNLSVLTAEQVRFSTEKSQIQNQLMVTSACWEETSGRKASLQTYAPWPCSQFDAFASEALPNNLSTSLCIVQRFHLLLA